MLEERFLMRVHRCSGTARSIASECKRAAPLGALVESPVELQQREKIKVKINQSERGREISGGEM